MAFKADNDKYLSRILWLPTGQNTIEAAKSSKDHFTRFRATQSDGKLLLKADTGLYLSRIHRSGIDYIEAAKSTPDVFCYFAVHNQLDGTVVLQADNGKYLSRVRRYVSGRGDVDYIEAYKSQIDVFCKFKLEFQL